MNYEDELERSRARKSRRREGTDRTGGSRPGHEESWDLAAEPGSRARRNRNASQNMHHKRRRNSGRKKKILLGVVIAVFALLAALVGGAYAYLNHHVGIANNQNEFDKAEVVNFDLPEETRERMEKGYWTIAVFGLDSRDSSTGKGNQSDVIMVVNLNRETGEIKLVSVFRDTYLNVNDKNTYNKINAAYAEGGPVQAVKALNKNLDLNITHYVSFNWKAVATAINILGGVDIDISKSEFYYINAFITETVQGTGIGSHQLKSAGMNHLDGVQAVAYGRLRLMDSDYARTERQRIVIQKAFEKAKKADLATLNSLVGNMAAMCATNIDTGEILGMAANITKYHLGESMGFPAARSEQKVKIGKNNLSCVIPQTLVSNVTSLHSFLYGDDNYTPSSTVQTISKKISDLTGLYNAGKEIGHVATDKGYIPKATTAAVSEETTKADQASESSTGESENGLQGETSEGETSEGETSEGEASEGETTETSEGESEAESGMHAGGWESSASDSEYGPMGPAGMTGPGHGNAGGPAAEGSQRPSSPLDMTRETTEAYGPGFDEEPVPEATSGSGGPASAGKTHDSDTQTSVIIIAPTKTSGEAMGPASQAPTPQTPTPQTPTSKAEELPGPASGV